MYIFLGGFSYTKFSLKTVFAPRVSSIILWFMGKRPRNSENKKIQCYKSIGVSMPWKSVYKNEMTEVKTSWNRFPCSTNLISLENISLVSVDCWSWKAGSVTLISRRYVFMRMWKGSQILIWEHSPNYEMLFLPDIHLENLN